MLHGPGARRLAEDNNLKDESMRRFGQRMTKRWCLMFVGVILGLLGVVAGPPDAFGAERDRVLLLGVSEGAQRDAAVTEALLKQLKGLPAVVIKGPDVNLLECQDPACWKKQAEAQSATVVVTATLTRGTGTLRAMKVELYDVASDATLGKLPRDVAPKDLPSQLAAQIRQLIKENEEERPQRAAQAAEQSAQVAQVAQAPISQSPSPAVIDPLPRPSEPAGPTNDSWWQRTSMGRKLAIGGLTIGALGLLAGGAVLYRMDGQGTMGPCTSGGDSSYRNCVTDYRGGYVTMFVAAPVMLGAAIYLAVKK